MSPDVLICDEPTNNLDPLSRDVIWNLLSEYAKDKIVLVISHENVPQDIDFWCYKLEDGKVKKVK